MMTNAIEKGNVGRGVRMGIGRDCGRPHQRVST